MDRMQIATGISRRHIYNILNGTETSTGSSKKNINFDDFDKQAIIRKIHQIYQKKEFPTLDKILEIARNDLNFRGGRTTLWKLLKSMGFKFKTVDSRKFLIERPEIVLLRHQYLRKIKKIRQSKPSSNIIYLDETWINTSHSNSKCWVDSKGTGGFPVPLGKGQRLIVVHAGSDKGFVTGAKLCFLAKKNTGDYHNEMNGSHFEKWMENQVFPNIPNNSVIIMDNASYHSVKSEKIPTSNSRKSDMEEWLSNNNIPHASTLKKTELYELLKLYKPRNQKYRIDDFARQHGHEIVRLPPYHCDLNPEELIWANIKGYVAKHNKHFNIKALQELFNKALDNVKEDHWKNAVKHVMDIENSYWERDNICDIEIEQVLIKLSEDSDSEDTDTASSEGE